MYRAYENPQILENRLEILMKEYRDASNKGIPEGDLEDMLEGIEEIEQRINIAYQNEYEEVFS